MYDVVLAMGAQALMLIAFLLGFLFAFLVIALPILLYLLHRSRAGESEIQELMRMPQEDQEEEP